MLNLNKVKSILSDIKPELLKRYPIASIGLFGSVVRNDFTELSDIDIVVSFNKPIGIEFVTLGDELESRLQRKVDLVSRNGIKDRYFKIIEPEIIYV
ncbi:MAG: nucleotidyltransferase family protein [Bacteroidota bacterium]